MKSLATLSLLLILLPGTALAAQPTAKELIAEGVRLQEAGQPGEAIERYKKAIAMEPGSASAFYMLGMAVADAHDANAGIFYLLRFVTLQPDEPRVPQASAKAFELLTQGVTAEEGKEIKVTLGAGVLEQDSGDLAAIELGRMLSAALIHTEDAKPQSKAQRYVSALESFVKIAGEMTQGDGKVQDSFVWKNAAAPIAEIERLGLLEGLAYYMAGQAGLEGAAEWLEKNPQRWQRPEPVAPKPMG
jgi:tetratricopeptide (TPR) repeat protein